MSTERSRRRADGRSVQANTNGKTRKFHFSTVEPFDGIPDDRPGMVLPPRFLKAGPKELVSGGCRYNVDGLLAHLFFWDRVAIPRPNKTAKLPEEFELIEYCHDRLLSAPLNLHAFDFAEDKPFEGRQEFHNRKTVRRSEIYKLADLEWQNQVQTFFSLEKKTPGVWSIADPCFQHRKLSAGRSLLVRLYDAVPIPASGVALLDVVEFKTKHDRELVSLRQQLAKLFLKIERSQDTEFAFNIEFSNLKESIADLISAFETSGMGYSFASVDSRLVWDFDYRVPLAAAVAAGSIDGLETALIAAAGGAAANLIPKVEVSAAHGKLQGTGNPLAYTYLISQSFGDFLPFASLSSETFLEDSIAFAANEQSK